MWARSPGKLYLQKQELCVHPRMESRVTNRHHTLHSEQHRSQQSGGGSSPSAHQWANRQAMIAYAHHRVWVSLKDGGSSDTCGKTGVNLDIMLGQQTRHKGPVVPLRQPELSGSQRQSRCSVPCLPSVCLFANLSSRGRTVSVPHARTLLQEGPEGGSSQVMRAGFQFGKMRRFPR